MRAVNRIFIPVLIFLLSGMMRVDAQVPELINNPEFRPDAKAAVDSIYNFQFDAADELMLSWKEKYPDHPVWILFDGMKLWWEILSDLQDTSRDEEFYHIMKRADYEAGKVLSKNSNHVDAMLIRAISNGYLARQHSNREEWISSLQYGRKAIKTHQYLKEQHPELEDLKLAEGLKLYYSAYLPEAYPAVRAASWFLPEGDKQKGIVLIQEASREAVFSRAEAIYFLGNISYNYENERAEATKYFKELHQRYPRNNYYARLLVKTYYRRQKYKTALHLIDSALVAWERDDLPHKEIMKGELLTWKGRILERKNDCSDALKSYEEAFATSSELPHADQRSFYAASGYGMGKLLFNQQRYKEAKKVLIKVEKAGGEPGYSRRASKLLSQIPD